MLNIVTYYWGHKYERYYVERLAAGIKRNMRGAYRFFVVTDRERPVYGLPQIVMPPEDVPWTLMDGCFARLRLFDPAFQSRHGLEGWIVSLDLDLVVVDQIDELWAGGEDFRILQGINTSNKCPYNGSVFMLKAGFRPDLWSDLNLEAIQHIPKHSFPDDQGWLAVKCPNAPAYGPACGVYGYKKTGWPPGDDLPKGARIVVFPGFRNPENARHIAWIKQHWIGRRP